VGLHSAGVRLYVPYCTISIPIIPYHRHQHLFLPCSGSNFRQSCACIIHGAPRCRHRGNKCCKPQASGVPLVTHISRDVACSTHRRQAWTRSRTRSQHRISTRYTLWLKAVQWGHGHAALFKSSARYVFATMWKAASAIQDTDKGISDTSLSSPISAHLRVSVGDVAAILLHCKVAAAAPTDAEPGGRLQSAQLSSTLLSDTPLSRISTAMRLISSTAVFQTSWCNERKRVVILCLKVMSLPTSDE
jgi:hypothetical protein